MNNTSWEDSLPELDRLLQSAGGYVLPSDDLRPRVLEAARVQHFERRTRRYVLRAALLCLLLCVTVSAGVRLFDSPAPSAAAGQTSDVSLDEPTEIGNRPPDPNWETVEEYRKLRVRQARLFQLPF